MLDLDIFHSILSNLFLIIFVDLILDLIIFLLAFHYLLLKKTNYSIYTHIQNDFT